MRIAGAQSCALTAAARSRYGRRLRRGAGAADDKLPGAETMASRNNPARRSSGGGAEKQFDGKTVKPVLYVGSLVGHGRYVAAQDDKGALVRDPSGKPLSWRRI